MAGLTAAVRPSVRPMTAMSGLRVMSAVPVFATDGGTAYRQRDDFCQLLLADYSQSAGFGI